MMPGPLFTSLDSRILASLPASGAPLWSTAGSVGARCGLTVEESRRVLLRLRDSGLVARSEGWPTRYALMPVIA